MSYPVFLLVALSVTIALAVALAGPLSSVCALGFWIANYYFFKWNYQSAPLETMSNIQLHDVLRTWEKFGSHVATGHQSKDYFEVKDSVSRGIAIYDELIVRFEKTGINTNDYKERRDRLIKELSIMVR